LVHISKCAYNFEMRISCFFNAHILRIFDASAYFAHISAY
jgi:hypothetical protein